MESCTGEPPPPSPPPHARTFKLRSLLLSRVWNLVWEAHQGQRFTGFSAPEFLNKHFPSFTPLIHQECDSVDESEACMLLLLFSWIAGHPIKCSLCLLCLVLFAGINGQWGTSFISGWLGMCLRNGKNKWAYRKAVCLTQFWSLNPYWLNKQFINW